MSANYWIILALLILLNLLQGIYLFIKTNNTNEKPTNTKRPDCSDSPVLNRKSRDHRGIPSKFFDKSDD